MELPMAWTAELNNEFSFQGMAQKLSEKAAKAALRKEFKAKIAEIPKLIKESQSRIVAQLVGSSVFIYIDRFWIAEKIKNTSKWKIWYF